MYDFCTWSRYYTHINVSYVSQKWPSYTEIMNEVRQTQACKLFQSYFITEYIMAAVMTHCKGLYALGTSYNLLCV